MSDKYSVPVDPDVFLKNHPHFLMPVQLRDGKMYMWYSICSKHRSHDPDCNLCQAGHWVQVRRVRTDEEIEQFGGGRYADS